MVQCTQGKVNDTDSEIRLINIWKSKVDGKFS